MPCRFPAIAAATIACCNAVDPDGPKQPQGLGPQKLWSTPALVVPPEESWQVLLQHLQQLAEAKSCWDSNGSNFLDTGRAPPSGTARALERLRALIEDSTRRYLHGSLKQLGGKAMDALQRIHVSIPSSWARVGCDAIMAMPHVHPKVAFAGSLYLDCVQGEDGSCGVYLQDPRTPAGMAEVPDTLRQRLGWGQLHRLQVAPGTLVLYPAWLQHGALMPRTATVANRSRAVISFLVAVQMQEKGDKLKRVAQEL